jgi:hypothetical protein
MYTYTCDGKLEAFRAHEAVFVRRLFRQDLELPDLEEHGLSNHGAIGLSGRVFSFARQGSMPYR